MEEVKMSNSEAIEKIKKLSDQERKVFELFCEDLLYIDIGDKLGIEESTVKKYMSNIRLKFEIDKMRKRKRDSVLRNKFCMALQTLKNQDQKKDIEERSQIGTEPTDTDDDANIDGEIVEPDFPDEKTQDQEKDKSDDNVIESIEKKNDGIPPFDKPKEPNDEKKDGYQMKKTNEPKRDRFRSLKTIWRVISIAAIIFSGYVIYDRFFGPNLFLTTPSVVEPEIEQEEIAVVDTQSQPTEEIQPTTIPTNTVVVPTDSPTPAQTLPSQPTILFEDDFESGLSDTWEVISGNPIVVNGVLSADQVSWLQVGDINWRNYSVEFNSNTPNDYFVSDFYSVGVRSIDIDNMYVFWWADFKGGASILENGIWKDVPQTDIRLYIKEMTNFRITVIDDLVTIYIDGEKQISFFSDTINQGKITLKLPEEAIIDDFKVLEILE